VLVVCSRRTHETLLTTFASRSEKRPKRIDLTIATLVSGPVLISKPVSWLTNQRL
jgi:hypothetical protein